MSSTRQGPGDVSPGPRPAIVTVEKLQARYAEVNPLVNAVCTPHPAALTDAARLDTEREDGRVRGPLHGLAVLVKDNIDTADLPTTAGSLALADQPPPPHDAPLVRRLREAGCIVLGKTNLSEWANFRGSASSSGWSAYGGLTRNPYALNRSAGGSSSGSGAAVAAGMADLAIGTETNGSIVCPAALNGVVGLKPTVGLIPQQGIVPISHSQDTAGPMTRTVSQAAALLTVLTGGATDYLQSCRGEDLSDLRIGVPRGPLWGYSIGLDRASEEALELLSRCGATLVDHLSLPTPGGDEDQLNVLSYELKVDLTAYLATRKPGGPRTLAELIAFNQQHADVELRYFGQELFERAEGTEGLDSPVYVAARLSALRAWPGRNRRTVAREAVGRARHAVVFTGLDDRPDQRRPRARQLVLARRAGGLPAAVGAVRAGRRVAGRHHLQRHRPQ